MHGARPTRLNTGFTFPKTRRQRLKTASNRIRDKVQTGGNDMSPQSDLKHTILETEEQLLAELRNVRRKLRGSGDGATALTVGQRVADTVAATMGSWRFIILQSIVLLAWIALNITAYIEHWDPYPFILLNLALSFQAAYAAPFIMMSQNRQQDIDRMAAENDYQINIKAELEIELLHQKIDQLRETEVARLTEAVSDLTALLKSARSEAAAQAASPRSSG